MDCKKEISLKEKAKYYKWLNDGKITLETAKMLNKDKKKSTKKEIENNWQEPAGLKNENWQKKKKWIDEQETAWSWWCESQQSKEAEY